MSKADRLKEQFGGKLAEAAMIRPGIAGPGEAAVGTDRYAGVKRVRNAGEIEIAKVATDPQVREAMDEAELEQLVVSIHHRGVLQPIRARWDEARSCWVCVAGHRRLEAAKR